MTDTKDAAPANSAPVFVQNGLDIVLINGYAIASYPPVVTEIAYNNGDGTFGSAMGSARNDTYLHSSVVLGDLDGDGLLDIITGSASDGVRINLNDGDGTFTFAGKVTQGLTSSTYSATTEVALGDFNADGRLDLVASNTLAGTRLFLGNGDGTFRAGTAVGGSGRIAIGDMNGDGVLDVVTTSYTTGVVSFGKGDGTIAKELRISLGEMSPPRPVQLADVNGDGRPDIITAITGGITVNFNLGNAAFSAPTKFTTDAGAPHHAIAIGDVDNDGKLDVVLPNRDGGTTVSRGNGDGSFAYGITVASPADGNFSVALGDINHDGWLDIVTANGLDGAFVNTNKGDGTFGNAILVATPGYRHEAIALGDLNPGSAMPATYALGTISADDSGRLSSLLSFVDYDGEHNVQATFTGGGAALGTLTAVVTKETSGAAPTGEVRLDYVVAPAVLAALAPGETRNETFDLALGDGTSTVHQAVSVTLKAANHAPTAVADAGYVTGYQGNVTILASDLLANDGDLDGERLILLDVKNPEHGMVTLLDGINGRGVAFTPLQGYSGTAGFDYVVMDASGATATAHVSITVGNLPVVLGSLQADKLVGTSTDELFDASGGNDTVDAGAGNDTFYAQYYDGNDTYKGGAGIDTLDCSQMRSAMTIDLRDTSGYGRASGPESGRDRLQSIENVLAGYGNDTIQGNNSANNIAGSYGNDRIFGNGGDDIVDGGSGNDTISGLAGDDTLIGGVGDDRLTGGGGHDTFVFHAGFGHDTITDFSAKNASTRDELMFDTSVFLDFASLWAHSKQVGSKLVITTDAGDSLTLSGMTLNSLQVYNNSIVTFV